MAQQIIKKEIANKFGWRWSNVRAFMGRWKGCFYELDCPWVTIEGHTENNEILMFLKKDQMIGWTTGRSWNDRSYVFHPGQEVNGKILERPVTAMHWHTLFSYQTYIKELIATPANRSWGL